MVIQTRASSWWALAAIAVAGSLMLGNSSASAQTTYTWADSNVTNTTPTTRDWFSGGINTQGTWTVSPGSQGNSTITNADTVQFFANTTTALTNTVAVVQNSIVNNGGTAVQLRTLTLSGRGSGTGNANLTINLSGDALNFSAATGTVNLDMQANGRTVTYSVANNVQLGTGSGKTALTFTGNGTGTFTMGGNITETFAGSSLVKSGTSTVILSGTNNYTGGTTLSGGTLSVGAAANLGDASSNLVFNGGTLQITGTNLTSFTSLGRTNSLTFTSGQTVGLDINNAANVFTADQALNQGTGGLTKAGAGTLVLNQANNYTGVTTIGAGTFQLGSGTATGSLSTSGTGINIASGATFAVNQSDTVTQGTDFNAFILGSGSLSNVGPGSLVLNTPTFHTGNTTATAGTITLSHQRAIEFSALNTTGAGSVTLSGTGSTTPIIGGLASSGTSRNLASVIDSSYASVTNLTLNPQSGSSFTYGGVIADGATGMTLTKTGAGTQTLTGANTYTGATTINGGTLNLGGATATGSLASAALNLGGGTLSYTRTGTNTQAFTTTNVTAGANSVTASLATQTINLGSLAGRVVGSTLDVSATGTITTTTANDATGILGSWATITNNNWAVSTGTDITGGATYYTTTTGGTTGSNYNNTTNMDVSGSVTMVGTINPNTIRFNVAAASVVTLAAGDNIVDSGGILITSTVGNNLSTITGGNLAGSAGGDLIIHQHNTSNGLTIGSLIKDNTSATALTKSGAGTLTLSGTNTFSGGVFINGGSLQVASAANLGDSANVVTFAGSSTLLFSSSTTLPQSFTINEGVTGTLRAGNQTVTVNGPLAGSGTLFVHGTSTSGINLTFASTNNTFSGDIQMRGDSGSYPVSLTMNSLDDTPGSLIRFGQNGQTPAFTYGAGAVAPLVLNHRRLENNAGSEFGPSFNNNATLASSTVTVNTDLILSGTVGNKPFTLGGSNTGDNTFAGAITDGAGGYVTRLTKAGAGTWILSNTNNSYTGATTINGGTLIVSKMEDYGVNSPVGMGTSGVGLAFGGGALNYTGTGDNTNRLVQVSGGSGTILNNGSGALSFTASGNFNVQGSTTSARTLSLGGANGGTISGAIQNNTGTGAALTLAKIGSGTWTLGATNTYTGTTDVNAGTLRLQSGASTITQTLGGLRSQVADGTLISDKSGVGSITTTFSSYTRSGGATGNIVSTGGTNGTDNSVNITGAAGFINAGLYFGGSEYAARNSTDGYVRALAYGSDPSTVAVNTVTANNHVKLTTTSYSGAGVTLSSLNLQGSGVDWTNTSGTLTTPGILKSGGGSQSTISGGSVATPSSSELVIHVDTSSDSIAISSNLIHGGGTLTKSGAGTLILSGTNTFTGQTHVNAGTLSIGANVNLGAPTTGATLNLKGGTLQATSTFGLFNGTAGTNNRAVTLLNQSGIDVTDANTLTIAGVISNNTNAGPVPPGFNKTGTGTLTVTGANTYTGATNVAAGTLNVSGAGSLNTTSAISVAAGARFANNSSIALALAPTLSGNGVGSRAVYGGTGTLNAALTLDNVGDVLSPGNSPGIMSFGANQSWGSYSYDWELNDWAAKVAGTNIDQINITGSLTLAGATPGSYILNVLSLTGGDVTGDVPNFADANNSWTILTTTAGISGFNADYWTINAAGFTSSPTATGSWNVAQSGNDLVLNYVAVPEPATIVLVASGAAILGSLLARRRRGS